MKGKDVDDLKTIMMMIPDLVLKNTRRMAKMLLSKYMPYPEAEEVIDTLAKIELQNFESRMEDWKLPSLAEDDKAYLIQTRDKDDLAYIDIAQCRYDDKKLTFKTSDSPVVSLSKVELIYDLKKILDRNFQANVAIKE